VTEFILISLQKSIKIFFYDIFLYRLYIFCDSGRVKRIECDHSARYLSSTRENKLVISRCAHYVRTVTVVEDYTSITRRNFKTLSLLEAALSLFLSLSLDRSALQPFVGYSMVLQSVTRAVTRPMGRRLRRGCLVSKSGLRSYLVPPSSSHFMPRRCR